MAVFKHTLQWSVIPAWNESPTHTTTPSINRKDVCLAANKHLSVPD